jgi:hypothetical protein
MDVAGDPDLGAILVWAGATSPNGAPTAILTTSNPNALHVGTCAPVPMVIADVTGDGLLDVISGSPNVTVGGVANAGALYVWKGGTSLVGTVTETATLVSPAPVASDLMNYVFVHDVTGDGVADVVGLAPLADVGAVVDQGAAYVWKGGATLVGTPAPLATLLNPSPVTGDQFPGSSRERIAFADLNGDGVDDLVLPCMLADWNGKTNSGVVFVFAGGATLTGTPAPLASCSPAVPSNNDNLPTVAGSAFVFGDVTGDGIVDLVTGSWKANPVGVKDGGACYVFAGGATLTGNTTPTATLALAAPTQDDRLCNVFSDEAIRLGDLDGDGVLDVVVGATTYDLGAVVDAGALFVWKGGATLTGSPAPSATLTSSTAAAADDLCTGSGHSYRLADVTGDGTIDVVAWSPSLDAAASQAGAILVFAGGPSMTGAVNESAVLTRAAAAANDQLGTGTVDGVTVQDVTGDGVLDVVGVAPFADVGAVTDAGVVLVWKGGATLTGAVTETAELAISSPTAGDQLGNSSTAVQFGDVTGDGVLDLLVGATRCDTTVVDGGAAFVWQGGAALVGKPAPLASLVDSSPHATDGLGGPAEQSLLLADLDDDGICEVVLVGGTCDTAGVVDAGELLVWSGGSSLAGLATVRARLRLGAPAAGDSLGTTNDGSPLRLVDLDGDGVLDLVVASPFVDAGANADTGALQFWKGGVTLVGAAKAPDLTLALPNPTAGDVIGN